MSGQDLVAQVAAEDTALLVHPGSGELVDTNDMAAVAGFLDAVRDHAKLVQDARKHAEWLLAEHARRIGAKTFEVDGRKVTVRDQDKISWDVEVLEQLLDLGLPDERWSQLVEQTVTVKVNTHVAKQIAASGNQAFADVIAKAQIREPGNLYVSVV